MSDPISEHLLKQLLGGDKATEEALSAHLKETSQLQAQMAQFAERSIGVLSPGSRVTLASGEEYVVLMHKDRVPGYYLVAPVCDDVKESTVLEAKVLYHPKTVAAAKRMAADPAVFLQRLLEAPEFQQFMAQAQSIADAQEKAQPKFIMAPRAMLRAGLVGTIGEGMLECRAGHLKVNGKTVDYDTPLFSGETYTLEWRGKTTTYTPHVE